MGPAIVGGLSLELLVMARRRLPVRPDLQQLNRQAEDLLRAIRSGEAEALEELHTQHPRRPEPGETKLDDARLVLARSYGATGWPRLTLACRLIDAIWEDDLDGVLQLVTRHPDLLHEQAAIRGSNWGPPMTYAANLGRDRIVGMLGQLGARDTESALERAVLQGKIATARMLYDMLPDPPRVELAGPAYTLSVSGTAFAFEVGARSSVPTVSIRMPSSTCWRPTVVTRLRSIASWRCT